jgi:uncharacterized membrane protein YidH (DUF202 family)
MPSFRCSQFDCSESSFLDLASRIYTQAWWRWLLRRSGVRLYWKEKSVRLFLSLGVAGLVYSMGQFSVFQGIIYALLPWMEKARAPDMAIVVYGFAISALVAFGTDGLLSTESSAPTKRQTANLVAGFSILFGIVLLGVLIANKLNWDLDARVMVPVLAGLALWGVFVATLEWKSAPRD